MHQHTHELTLGLAFFLGALHALEPGHGKTAMLVYLSGERRGYWHPLVMGFPVFWRIPCRWLRSRWPCI